ncbi:alpha/beta hydrolase [Novosphingobium sp. Gsoil 351]|uniref:alpha/beta hydrolase n=1 Tax=Novosphingobium sp. Gsoil 351 TaxID=2675225 RepID=UPI0018A84193|nr:alpha/beta hydrolase-fold protein [Novosphingobium sp. Gsoil 351]
MSEASRPSTEMALNAHRIDFTSEINGTGYRLLISEPAGDPPPEGWPVVYLIDGNLHFGISVDTARVQERWPEVREAVIVGIAYQTDSVAKALQVRTYDLTPATPLAVTERGWMRSMGAKPEDFGGIDDYLRIVEEEVKPRVRAYTRVSADDTLMGHSLGGLTTLYAILRHPASFRQYVAVSPSIWVNDRWVLQFVDGFIEAVKSGAVEARFLLSTGELEEADPPFPPYPVTGFPSSEENYVEMTRSCGMVTYPSELAARLKALRAPGFDFKFVIHPDEDHRTVVPAGIARGIFYTMFRHG